MDMAMAEEGGKQMENTNKIDLIEWIQKAFHVVHKTWKALILLVAFCSMVFIGRAVLNYSPVYESKVTFSVIKEYNGNSNFTYNKEATDRLSSSFLTIIQSDLMISTICEDLQVSSIPATFRVERIESTNLFSVYATSENPEDAKAVLDSLTRNYNQISRVALNDAVLNVIEEAELPVSPANSIDYVHEISRGVMVGIAGYLVIAVLYAAIRRAILRPEDIKVYLHSHCLCAVPKVKVLKGKPVRICDQIAHVDHLKDSFHKVRLEMENAAKEKDQRVFMVTSASAHEGKSMAAANLALSLANKGHRVLLLDFDLRNPTQMKTFDLKAEDADRITLSDTEFFSFHQVVHDTLDVVSVSAVQDQATEILGGEEVKKSDRYAADRDHRRQRGHSRICGQCHRGHPGRLCVRQRHPRCAADASTHQSQCAWLHTESVPHQRKALFILWLSPQPLWIRIWVWLSLWVWLWKQKVKIIRSRK